MIWDTFKIEEKKIYYGQIGPLQIWIKKEWNDWYLAINRKEDNWEMKPLHKIHAEEQPATLDWIRWVVNDRTDEIHFIPAMPDRPLIIRPEIPILIPANNFGKFYINIPLWLKLEVGEHTPLSLCELPIFILSNSWLGDTMSGEKCYSKKSFVRRDVETLDKSLAFAVCTLEIHNNSKTVLNFERICLTVENLSIFGGKVRFWTNPINVIFQGEDQLSQITISRTKPEELKHMNWVIKPRKPIDTNILKKSFQFFKNLTGF